MTFFNKRLDLSQREYDCLKSCIDFKKLEEFVNKENDYLDEYKVLNKLINKLNNSTFAHKTELFFSVNS